MSASSEKRGSLLIPIRWRNVGLDMTILSVIKRFGLEKHRGHVSESRQYMGGSILAEVLLEGFIEG